MANYPIISQDTAEPLTVSGILSAIPNAIFAPYLRSKIIDGQLILAKQQQANTKDIQSQILSGVNEAVRTGNFTPEVQAFYAMLWASVK